MAMAVDSPRHPMGAPMGYDNHMHYPGQAQQWHNPWGQQQAVSTAAPGFNPSLATTAGFDQGPKPAFSKPTSIPMPAYTAAPTSQPMAFNPSYSHPEAHEAVTASRGYDVAYAPAPPTHPPVSYQSSSPSNYGMSSYGSAVPPNRRLSQGLGSLPPPNSFGGPLDNARTMILNQDDVTPRNIYGGHDDRNSSADYGFPAAHSNHGSVSSASSGYPYHYASSVDSATDYSSCSESVGSFDRTLPRPSGLMTMNIPPAPATMMGSFNSKVSSSAQKKHKCKVCDKRFTRPSSLQTHMYSHTGEKPFACEVPGCGRNFSVVSNLRRHRKVHKGDSASVKDEDDHASPAESWTSSRKNSV